MCGICGIINFDGSNSADPELVRRMCRRLAHRGPDGEGFHFDRNVGLGHRRLSIIDLVGGSQPMANEDRSIWIVQNGEIYNYLELARGLKQRGHKFRTQSDTEVILHLYEEYGEGCLEHLNGMFAFVIWDRRNKRLFAGRDRLGIKPLYYYIDNDRFIFASEIKAILEAKVVARAPNYQAMGDYLRFTYSTDDQTFFKNIKKLLPAHCLVLNDKKLSVREYWAIPAADNGLHNEEDAAAELKGLLGSAVDLHLRSDVAVGAHLSGGMDSGTVVALSSQKLSYSLKTFSGAFDEGLQYDERPYIRLVADRYKTEHHEIVPKEHECIEAVSRLVWMMDEPAASSGIIAQYFLNKLICQHVKVVLGGQGGDELFAGYYRFLPMFIRSSFVRSGAKLRSALNIFDYIKIEGAARIVEKIRRRQGMLGLVLPEVSARFREEAPKPVRSIDEMQAWEISKSLPSLLQVEDRTSMAFSVESRVPLLDYRLVEFAASVPFELKARNFRLKHLLRKVAASYLPREIVNRKKKQGFISPVPVWFRKSLFAYVNDILSSQSFRERGIFDLPKIKRNLDLFKRGRADFSEQIWQLLNIELWHRTFIDRKVRQ